MAINAYVGVPGSGKSYEVVKSVILKSYLSGRSIVTNINGVSEEKFKEYAIKHQRDLNLDLNKLGKILKVDDDEVKKVNFFPFNGSNSEQTIAKNGDLICLDEVWRIFPDDKKIPEEHRSFVAEHRHFANEDGVTSDLVVINQSISNVPKFIKDRVEQTFVMHKLKALGLNSRYRVDVYSTAKLIKRNFISQYQEKYDPEIFKLYSSYDSEGANELVVDDRGNLFKNKFFLFKFIFAILIILFSVYYFYSKFKQNEDLNKELTKESSTIPSNVVNSKDLNKNDVIKSNSDITSKVVVVDKQLSPKISDVWRIVGEFKKDGRRVIILSDRNGTLRTEYNAKFKGVGMMLKGEVDGEIVTYFSGQQQIINRGFYDNGKK